MNYDNILKQLLSIKQENNKIYQFQLLPNLSVLLYPFSITQVPDHIFFIGRMNSDKYLWVISKNEDSVFENFEGTQIKDEVSIKYCHLNNHNAHQIRNLFDFTKPVLLGYENSYGFGDRLGLANPGHIRAVRNTYFRAVLAQQSIRELERTQRDARDVVDAATWGVFQEGYKKGFGADADHLKTTEDIDRMMAAGFTIYTFDPGMHVVNNASILPGDEIENFIKKLDWVLLKSTPEKLISEYADRKINISSDFDLEPTKEEVLTGLVKYGKVLEHVVKMFRHLNLNYSDKPFEVELSIDETDSPTSLFEHYFIVNELKRLEVKLVSVAPRFIGDFEKGIDYKGDLEAFKREYIKHLQISEKLGPYKISIHSGSDKFALYEVIGSLRRGYVHVKTAGTSYLEALRTVAMIDPDLLREILRFACDHYENEKLSYFVSADLNKILSPEKYSNSELLALFEMTDARQIFHVTFGKVLTTKNQDGKFLFKDKILSCLNENEDLHYEILERHFNRHIKPFIK